MQENVRILSQLKDRARKEARELLARSASFRIMDKAEQLGVYKDIVDAEYNKLAAAQGLVKSMAGPQKAGDLIDDKRHKNENIERAGDIAENFMDGVDFPGFVRDLLKGVFDANLEVTVKQMQEFQNLMKAATASISKFIKDIDDTAAMGYLAENNSEEVSLSFDEETKEQVLVDRNGNKLDLGNNEIKAKIMDAKIAMAKEQRALLRETLLMGVTRLVVERGTVKAGVLFDIKAKEKIEKGDKGSLSKQTSSGTSFSGSGGLIGKIFGGFGGGHTSSSRESQISISSAKSVSDTELKAQITGSVEIIFKSDYFKLDNFAAMYGPVKDEPNPNAQAAPAAQPATPAR